MSNYSPWTPEEKEFVVKNARQLTDQEIGEKLGRTEGSISTFRYRNNIEKSAGNHYKTWTEKEKEIIKKHWPGSSKETIQKLLPGRTLEAIQTQARSMNISRSDHFRKATEFKPNRVVKETEHGTVTLRKCGEYDYAYINTPNGAIPYHRFQWEEKVGPIPEGFCLRCKTEIRTDANPENWELVSIKRFLATYADSEAGAKALNKYRQEYGLPAKELIDEFVAGVLAQGDPEMKEIIINEYPELIRVARANMKLNREIRNNGTNNDSGSD